MRFILFLIIIILVAIVGLTILDYFGYYIDWDKSILSLTILILVAKAIQTFLTKPGKELKKFKEKLK